MLNALASPPSSRAQAAIKQSPIGTHRDGEFALVWRGRFTFPPRAAQHATFDLACEFNRVERIRSCHSVAFLLKADPSAASAEVRLPGASPVGLCKRVTRTGDVEKERRERWKG